MPGIEIEEEGLAGLYGQHVQHLHSALPVILQTCEYDGVLLHAGDPLKQRLVDDQYWPLRVNPSYAHWLPCAEPGNALLVRPDRRPLLLRQTHDSFWEGAPPPCREDIWEHIDVCAGDVSSMADTLGKGRIAFVGDSVHVASRLGITTEHQNPDELCAALEALRTMKTRYEATCLARANAIAALGHKTVADLFASEERSELELHLVYLMETQQDAMETPYQNIVAMGRNAATLHHVNYCRTRDTASEQSLLLDAGATYMGYASDITRTWVRGEDRKSRDFRALVDGVEKIGLHLSKQAGPGDQYEELHDQAHQLLAALLADSGLCSGAIGDLVEAKVTRAFFPHGLGHSLGIQVHDVGCRKTAPKERNAFLRNTATIRAGQVFTIEPGCYFIDALLDPIREDARRRGLVNWPMVDELHAFGGIRVEDNIHVTPDGNENLTRESWPETI